MSDLIDLDNLTLSEIRRLRKGLFERLLFEPVTDPDFERPVAKLRDLTRQSASLIDRLRAVVHRYDQYLEVLSKIQTTVENGRVYMDTVHAFGIRLPSVEHMLLQIAMRATMPPVEREQVEKKETLNEALRQEALILSTAFLSVTNTTMCLSVTLRWFQLMTAQLWALLEKTTLAVTKGTSEAFHRYAFPAKPDELLSDAVDKAVDKAELPNLTPVLHVIEFVFKYIRRQEILEEKLADTWTEFEMHIFLAGYFNWWAEGGGGAVLEDLVAQCEASLRGHEEVTQQSVIQAAEFGRALADFQVRVDTASSNNRDEMSTGEHKK